MGVKFLDLFCGAGGASAGLVAAGLECFMAVDFDPVALASHKANHPEAEHILMDMTKPAIRWERLREQVDLVHGSPPCQNLSSANNNADHSKALPALRAYEEVVEIIQPRWFTMENVPMVRYHLNGLFRKVRQFNAADFGVPQTRTRVFAGDYPEPRRTHTRNGPQETLTGGRLEQWISLGEALGLEGYVNTGRDWRGPDQQQERESDEPAPTFSAKAPSQWKFVDRCFEKVRNGPSIHSADRPSTTVTSAADRMEVLPPADVTLVSKNTVSGKKGTRLTRGAKEPAFTLTTHQGGVKLYPGSGEPGVGECRAVPRDLDQPAHTMVVKPPSLRAPSPTITATEDRFGGTDQRRAGRAVGRRLSLEECAALQSFPPGYIFLGNKTQRQRQIGNAVPPKMAEAIGRAIMNEHRGK